MKKVMVIVVVVVAWAIVVAGLLAYPGQVQITSPQGEIPIVGGLYRMGPSTGFPVPFMLTQVFAAPLGATTVYGTIAPGPCEAAEFIWATPGYTTGDYPIQACSWIMWEPAPSIVTVMVEYTGNWTQNYVSQERWAALESGEWEYYCLIGTPSGSNCPWALYLEAQPSRVFLPTILRGFP